MPLSQLDDVAQLSSDEFVVAGRTDDAAVLLAGTPGYAAKRLQKRRVPLQVIMQIGGWKREAMPTRYIGKYDEDELKDFPTANLRDVLAR